MIPTTSDEMARLVAHADGRTGGGGELAALGIRVRRVGTRDETARRRHLEETLLLLMEAIEQDDLHPDLATAASPAWWNLASLLRDAETASSPLGPSLAITLLDHVRSSRPADVKARLGVLTCVVASGRSLSSSDVSRDFLDHAYAADPFQTIMLLSGFLDAPSTLMTEFVGLVERNPASGTSALVWRGLKIFQDMTGERSTSKRMVASKRRIEAAIGPIG
jgi:hypothetical protein